MDRDSEMINLQFNYENLLFPLSFLEFMNFLLKLTLQNFANILYTNTYIVINSQKTVLLKSEFRIKLI